ncbi:MAG: glycosyl hydrolase, partial [Candidatus Zophobacter franzmannii]|nr:glycosyl hydrolase [Candidatus Zophobacter franzmannii]
MANVVKWFYVALVLLLSLAGQAAAAGEKTENNELTWPEMTSQHKPWAYWWWMGSAVDQANLKHRLKEYHQAGMGGLHVTPIYGVKGYEDKFIDFLTPKWISMLTYTVEQAAKMGLGIDMSTGTGWPFGGAMVGDEDTACKAVIKSYTLSPGQKLNEPLTDGQLMSLMGCSDKGTIVNLLDKVKQGKLTWTAPDGDWKLYAVFQNITGQHVKRAAPGAEGKVLDPLSTESLNNYLDHFDAAFADYKNDQLPRAQYHDSYEYYGANWTDNFLGEFSCRRGYDLRSHMPAFFGEGETDKANRVKCDYKETISDLHLEFIETWTNWAHDRGFITRDEAHGALASILDVYAASDIPETETFGPSRLPIPGLRIDPDFNDTEPDILVLKFASSAAHVSTMGLTALESCTWLAEHFKVALSQAKAQIDQLFVAGVNHLFYHGTVYSPIEEDFPGWLFYATTSFSPSNYCIWHDIDALN